MENIQKLFEQIPWEKIIGGLAYVMFLHTGLVFIALTACWSWQWRSIARSYAETDKEAEQAFLIYSKNVLIWANLPWAVMAMGQLTGNMHFYDIFQLNEGNPFAIGFFVAFFFVMRRLYKWLYWQNGAEESSKYNLVNAIPWNCWPMPCDSPSDVKKVFWVTLGIQLFTLAIIIFIPKPPIRVFENY